MIHNSYNLIICAENEDGYTYLWFNLKFITLIHG
jgi:hypothetical protein